MSNKKLGVFCLTGQPISQKSINPHAMPKEPQPGNEADVIETLQGEEVVDLEKALVEPGEGKGEKELDKGKEKGKPNSHIEKVVKIDHLSLVINIQFRVHEIGFAKASFIGFSFLEKALAEGDLPDLCFGIGI